MSSFEAFKTYMALKSHFTRPSYNYFKFNGKMKLRLDSFEKRKDKLFFQKLAKHSDVYGFLVANLALNEKAWIRDLVYSDEAERTYKAWNKRQQSIAYTLKEELSKLHENFDDNLKCIDNDHPYLLKLYLSGEISLETLCLILNITGAKKYWDKVMQYDLVWDNISTKVEKYTPFIQYDKEKIKKIVIQYFS